MGRAFLIVLFLAPAMCMAQNQPFTVDDLLALSSQPPKNFESYIDKKGFPVKRRNICDNQMGFTFFENTGIKVQDSLPVVTRSIDLYKKGDTWCFALHTSSLNEYINERSRLKTMNFFSGNKDISLDSSLLFQKRAITIQAGSTTVNDDTVYTILLTKKEMPDPNKIRYAEDLLNFDSHEYLVDYFGEKNVRKDIYNSSGSESMKCSVLFPNSPQQAVFIWGDENNFRQLSVVLISGTITTASTANATQYAGSFRQNTWISKNGIYSGMRIKDLLQLNANDFQFYGSTSELSLMVEPKVTGNINFKHVGVILNCFNCTGSVMMDRSKISAEEAINNSLALSVSYLMIRP